MANARATAELAKLHAAMLQRATLPAENTPCLPVTGPGSGCGSITAYHEIMAKNGHGRLGRTHMEDVDRLRESVRAELDSYLRRAIHKTFPVGAGYCTLNSDQVFATLAAFGLRLEDRGPMADGIVFPDNENCHTATVSRLQNFARHYYTARTNKYEVYWEASAMETLIELARYRGLVNDDGFLIAAK